MRYFIRTFGCQMNVADSAAMAECLRARGFAPADAPEEADVVVVNTCSVRSHAEQKAESFLGRLKAPKSDGGRRTVIFAGCMAERTGESIRERFPFVDLVVGARSVGSFSRMVDGCLPAPAGVAPVPPEGKETGGTVCAFVTAMRGCNNFCSYCIVPYVRGEERSVPPEDILGEAARLTASGVREITLLGQNVNSYRGTDAAGREVGFPELLTLLDGIRGLERIRFMTSHPKDLSDRLIDAMADLEHVCPHLHLPLQSGSDRILAAMNRRYSAKRYLSLVERLRARVPGVSLTTDILTGFPGETEDDFRCTLKTVEAVGYDFLFAFKYSSRPGTAASRLDDDVASGVKEERLARILETAGAISMRLNAALKGSVQEVLVESRRGDGLWEGKNPGNKKVFFRSDGKLTGRTVRVLIDGSRINSLTGTVAP